MSKFKFGKTSLERLSSCHKDIQKLMHTALSKSDEDFTILQGHRGEEEQNKFFKEKKSKLMYPNSKHNMYPSIAVDIAPYPIDWEDTQRFKNLAKVVLECAKDLDLVVRWGGDWDRDGDTFDQTFNDLPHFELDWKRR